MRNRRLHPLTRLWFLAALSGCASPSAHPSGPNVILVSIDSLRPDHLGCYGYAEGTSPTLDRVAAEGVCLRTALSTTSWTLPAHAAMFTGLYDVAHGLVDNGLALGDVHRTLAETLRAAGYHTAGFFGGPYLHPVFGLDQGFEIWESCMSELPDRLSAEQLRRPPPSVHAASHADVTGPRTLDAVTRWAESRRPEDGPYFLFVHLWDVHYDYLAPTPYTSRFDRDYAGDLDGAGFLENPRIGRGMSPRDYRHLMALYDAEIRFTDDHLGRILEVLERRGLMDDTVLVITSDHGEEFLEHGLKGHNKTLFREVVKVPLVVRWPGRLDAGRVVSEPVRLIDLMPTLLTLAGVPEQPEVLGRDLSRLLLGMDVEPQPALLDLGIDGRNLQALRVGSTKVIRKDLGASMVFDLDSDPSERHALPPRPGQLEALDAERERALAFGRRVQDGVREVRIDDEVSERLRSLGYTGSSGDGN